MLLTATQPALSSRKCNAVTGPMTQIQLENQGYKQEINTITTFNCRGECIKVCVLPEKPSPHHF